MIIFKKLHPDAVIPSRATEGSAGLDLRIIGAERDDGLVSKDPLYFEPVYPGCRVMALTGLACQIPEGTVGLLAIRSSIAVKHGVTLINSPGILDSDYRGEIKLCLINHGSKPFEVVPGMRIAQLIPVEVALTGTWGAIVEDGADCPECSLSDTLGFPCSCNGTGEVTMTTTDRGTGGFGSTGE